MSQLTELQLNSDRTTTSAMNLDRMIDKQNALLLRIAGRIITHMWIIAVGIPVVCGILIAALR